MSIVLKTYFFSDFEFEASTWFQANWSHTFGFSIQAMSLDVKTTQKYFNDNVSWTLSPSESKSCWIVAMAMASGCFISFDYNFGEMTISLCSLLVRQIATEAFLGWEFLLRWLIKSGEIWKRWWREWTTPSTSGFVSFFLKTTIIPKKLIDVRPFPVTEMMIILESSNSGMIIAFLVFFFF